MTLRQFIYPLTIAILSGVAVSSCSSSDIEPVVPGNGETSTSGRITMSISAAPLSGRSTRADFPELPAESAELINEWYIAFLDETGNVVAVEDNGSLAGVWNDVVSTELELYKTYTALAFANFNGLPKLKEGDTYSSSAEYAQSLGLVKGGTNVDLTEIKESIYKDGIKYLNKGDLIPMSGYLEFTPRGTVNEIFAIEVVRLYSRVEFAFEKNVDDDIIINSISLGSVNVGSISLMPNYDKKPKPNTTPGNSPIFPTTEVNYETITPGMSALSVPNEKEGDDITSIRPRFYIKESVVDKDERFKIGINLTRGSGTDAVTETIEALTDKELRFFYRNDYVLFPIKFNYTPEIKVYDYPPIGGYPVQVTVANGTEYTAMFSSSGAFDIETSIVDKNGNVIELGSEGNGNTNYVEWNTADKPAGFNISYDSVSKRWFGGFPLGYDKPIRIDFKFHVGDLVYSRSLTLIGRK